jgi:putative transposase
MERTPEPSLLVIDTQSIKTTKMAAIKSRGYDGGKKVKGRKRVMVVDTQGFLVDVSVVPANMHDTKAGRRVLIKVAKRQKKKRTIKTVLADKGFRGIPFSTWVKKTLGAVVQTSENLAQKVKRFVPAKKRWVVERTHAWMLDYRRLVVDHERLLKNSITMIRIAFIRVLLRRLHPMVGHLGEW